jgi:hypothetical protein
LKRIWETDELIATFTLSVDEIVWLGGRAASTQLGRAIQLKCLQYEGRFPEKAKEVPLPIVEYIAQQLGVNAEGYVNYEWAGRTGKTDRMSIRERLGFRPIQEEDYPALTNWLLQQPMLYEDPSIQRLSLIVYEQLRDELIEPPSRMRMQRLIRSALRQFEGELFRKITAQLPTATQMMLDGLLDTDDPEEDYSRSEVAELKMDAGKLGVKSILQEAERLSRFQQIQLPDDLFTGLKPNLIEKYAQRVMAEAPSELRRHPAPVRYTLLACFCWQRQQQVTDNLIRLLIQIIHRMNTHAETKVKKTFIADVVQVTGKQQLLYQLAEAALTDPEGSVRDVIFSVVNEETLRRLVNRVQGIRGLR